MSKQEITMEKTMTTEDVVAYLEQLAEGLKNGRVVVQKEEKTMVLSPPSIMEVEVEAKQKKNKEKFCLEFSWKTDGVVKVSDTLTISSTEPESHA